MKNRFKIDFKNGSEFISIYPQQREQIFSITVSSKRRYENEDVYKSPIVSIHRRYCWTDPFPPVPNETQYFCSEDGRRVRFKLDYFSVKSLSYPFLSDCVSRPDNETQIKCYENCVKKEKTHYFLTYRDFASESKLIFDNASTMQDLVNRCLGRCTQPDCNYGSFDVANIINESGNGSIALEIMPTDHRTEVIPRMSKENLIYCLVVYVYLLFGWNVYETFLKNVCLRTYFNHLKRRKKRQKQSCKLAAFSFVTLIVGLTIGTLCEWRLFNFGKEDKMVVIKRESTYEINVTISICFNLSDILLNRNASATDEELFESNSLAQLNTLTWSVEDFKKVSSMKNSVGPVPIRHKEKEIWMFYRHLKKCFLIYYETKQLFPHIYLQRKSHIYFNVTGTEYSYFYVEQNKKYPQLESPKIEKSTLFTLRQNNFKESNCKRYSEERDKCLCKDDCIQDCVVATFVRDNRQLPAFANVKNEPHFQLHGSLNFSRDRAAFERALAKCEFSYPEVECDAVNITLRPKYIVEDQHNISINLTPNMIVHKELEDEDRLVVFNRIIGVLVILTGFSIRELFDEIISILYNLQMINRIVSLPALLNFRLAKRLVNLFVFLLFATHFGFLYQHIISHEMLQISYKNFLNTISLPKLRVCYEHTLNLTLSKFTKKDLDDETLSIEQFFIGLNYLDDDFHRVFAKVNASDNKVFTTQQFYLDNLKCFSISVKKTTPVANANILLIDQLLTVFIDLQNVTKKRYLVYLNVDNTIDLEWSTYLHTATYYNLYFSTKKLLYNDSFFYLRNLKSYLKRLLNLSGAVNTQRDYFHYLRKSYNTEQYVSTTVVPLEENSDLVVKNEQFNAFIWFRSIDGDKNEWDFTHNSQIPRFSYDIYKEAPERRNEDVSHKGIIALRPNLSVLKNKVLNKYNFVEFFLHLLILVTFWLKFTVLRLPECVKEAWPVVKFFINLFLYVLIVILIFIFDISFKFFGFFK